MNKEFGRKIMKEVVTLISKTYSYLTNNYNENKNE